VATSAGGRSLEDFSDAISVADDPDTFTGRVLELLECKDTRLKISQRALAAASEWQRHQLIALGCSNNWTKTCVSKGSAHRAR
jgi:hypothetical protein